MPSSAYLGADLRTKHVDRYFGERKQGWLFIKFLDHSLRWSSQKLVSPLHPLRRLILCDICLLNTYGASTKASDINAMSALLLLLTVTWYIIPELWGPGLVCTYFIHSEIHLPTFFFALSAGQSLRSTQVIGLYKAPPFSTLDLHIAISPLDAHLQFLT